MDHERQTSALQRLLADAREGGPAKVDALLALVQRTVFVVPWPNPEDGWRTLVSSGGDSALPIFSDRAQLEEAASRFGWSGADGTSVLEVGSRETLRYARDRSLSYVVVDIASEHSIEITPAEMEPLLTPAARRDSSGPFSGAGRVSSTLMRAVRATPSPMPAMGSIEPPRLEDAERPSAVLSLHPPPPGQAPLASAPRVSAPIPAPPAIAEPVEPLALLPSAILDTPAGTVDEALLDRLHAVLRNYPEVEFGCIGAHQGNDALGLRIDARLRTRLETLAADLGGAAGGPLVLILLDDTEHFRAARANALVFFPWRRR